MSIVNSKRYADCHECGERYHDEDIERCMYLCSVDGNYYCHPCVNYLGSEGSDESMGYDTGIDLEALLSVRQEVAKLLPEEEWFGFTAAAGLPKHFGDVPLQEAS